MVMIDPDKSVAKFAEIRNSTIQKPSERGEFDAEFRRAVDATTAQPGEVESVRFDPEVRPSRFDTQALPMTGTTVDQVQQLIDTMEVYGQKLAETGATLKEIEPLIEKMVQQSRALTPISEGGGEEDDLGAIANQALTLASVEIARFNSGFYSDD